MGPLSSLLNHLQSQPKQPQRPPADEGPLPLLNLLIQAIINHPAYMGQTVATGLKSIKDANRKSIDQSWIDRGYGPNSETQRNSEMIQNMAIAGSMGGGDMANVSWAVPPTGPAKYPMLKDQYPLGMPDSRGGNQLQIEDAVNKGDILAAKRLSSQANQSADFLNNLPQKVPYTETSPGVYSSTAPLQRVMQSMSRGMNYYSPGFKFN